MKDTKVCPCCGRHVAGGKTKVYCSVECRRRNQYLRTKAGWRRARKRASAAFKVTYARQGVEFAQQRTPFRFLWDTPVYHNPNLWYTYVELAKKADSEGHLTLDTSELRAMAQRLGHRVKALRAEIRELEKLGLVVLDTQEGLVLIGLLSVENYLNRFASVQ